MAFAALATTAGAQMNYPQHSDSLLTQSTLEVDGTADFLSTSLYSDMSHTLLFGGFIDEKMIARSFERHREINRCGFNLNSEVRYIHGKGKLMGRDSVTWMIKGGVTGVGNLSYGHDVFGLLFFGNSAYRANTAVFTNTRMDFFLFQKLGFGIVNKKDRSSVTLNVVNVQQMAQGFIRKGEMTQNEDGSQIDMRLRGDFQHTNNNAFSNGLGLSLDIDYRMRVRWGKASFTTFQLSTQNLGLAYMYNGLTRYVVDSSYTYSGFQVDQLTSGSGPFGSGFSVLDSLGIEKHTVRKMVTLPGYIQAMKLIDPDSPKKVQSYFGFRLYPTLNAVPSVFAGAYWKTAARFHAAASVSYGGFGLIRGGIYALVRFDKLSWMLGTDDIVGSISKYGYGQSLVTRLLWKLN